MAVFLKLLHCIVFLQLSKQSKYLMAQAIFSFKDTARLPIYLQSQAKWIYLFIICN